MPLRTDFHDHIQLVEAIADVGVQPPEGWTALRQRHADYMALQFPLRDRLAGAILEGTDADLSALRALVVAEQLAQTGSQANAHVEGVVLQRLREIYAAVAADNYRAVAALFDGAAQRFGDTANTVDVEAGAATMIDKPDKARQAYLAAESYANELTRLTVPLGAAATLASRRDIHPGDDLAVLPLVADTTGKRRTIWDAWDTKGGRCGHWGALHRAAIAIRAADLDTYQQPYRRPLPITHEQRQVPGAARGVIEWVSVDPEEPAPVYPIDPVRRPTGRGVAV
jgi:hypothetical protein